MRAAPLVLQTASAAESYGSWSASLKTMLHLLEAADGILNLRCMVTTCDWEMCCCLLRDAAAGIL